jgi:hypothetical protein
MKKQLLSLVLTLAMVISLFAGLSVTAGASNTGAIPVNETLDLTDDTRNQYYIENYDYDDFFENPDAHWRYAYMSAAEGDAYLETLKSATLGTAVAPSNSVRITSNSIPYERYTGNHDRLVLLKVLNAYDASNPTYVVQSYAYFKLSDKVDSIKVAVNAAVIPEMVPGQALVQGNDYEAFGTFMGNVISFVDGEKLDPMCSGVMDLVAKAPNGSEWMRVNPKDPIQAGYTYGVLVHTTTCAEKIGDFNAYYCAYLADRGAGVTVTCTNGNYNIVTADATLGDVTDTSTSYAFIVELLTTPSDGGNTPPAGGSTIISLEEYVKIEENVATIKLPEGRYYIAHGSVAGAEPNQIEYILNVFNQPIGKDIVTLTSDMSDEEVNALRNAGLACLFRPDRVIYFHSVYLRCMG